MQPPGYVHSLLASTWEPLALATAISDGEIASVSAQQAADGAIVVVRLVNNAPQPLNASVTLLDATAAPLNLSGRSHLAAWSLQSANLDAANTAAEPRAVSPVALHVPLESHGATVAMRPYDYTVLQFTLGGRGEGAARAAHASSMA